MNKIKQISAAVLVGSAMNLSAQVPQHPMYVDKLPTYVTDRGETKEQPFYMYFESWSPGSAITEDDNFYISRVRPQKRFSDEKSQVDPNMKLDRKLCWWCPIGVSDKSWGALPRYIMDADNFSMWQYIDIHGNWSDGWIRVPGAFSDIAHRNGVENGCVLFFDSTVSDASETGKTINTLIAKENGQFKNTRKLIQFMKYYGIDGLGINPEGALSSGMVAPLKEFFEECHKIAIEEGWHFKVHWYESMTNAGYVSWTDQLSMNNNEWFQRSGSEYPVSDMFMLNYNWQGSKIPNSISVAKDLKRSPFDVYAGFDSQGRWIRDTQYNNPDGGWKTLYGSDISIAIWGAHAKNMIYENSNEFGSDDLTLQTTYQKKQEQFFTGGTRNPANCPNVTNSVTSSSWNAMSEFHGISKFIPARSTLNQLPFVTRFGLGNGQFFKQEGKTTFNQKWYNIGVQDLLPTWRWWILDDNGQVPADAVNCEFTFEDAWHAGTSLKLSGATAKSNIRMFKTDFDVAASNEITVRYKVLNGTEPHLNLMWSADGKTFKSYPMAPTAKAGEWGVTQVTAEEAGMTGKVAVIGFSVAETNSNYELLLGEFSIDNKQAYNPVKPEITSYKVLTGTYNSVSFKLIYKSKDQEAAKITEPVYNDEVDTWYFEIYSQPENGDKVLCATTTSWAAYVVGAPASLAENKNRFGVCAVAPDGVTRSEIAWTEYAERPIVYSDNVVIDKQMIKVGEPFTIKYEDPSHAKAYSWEIINSATGIREGSLKMNTTSLSTSINKEGSYDLIIRSDRTDREGTAIRGLIQITPMETGAIPTIGDFSVNKEKANVNEDVTASFTITRLGEGQVSRGVAVRDPEMLRLPAEIGSHDNYSIALWFKPEKWAHGRFGTNLINKRDFTGRWPHNNWGTFWVHVWPENAYPGIKANVLSFTQWNMYDLGISPGYNGNIHESPNQLCMAPDHSLALNSWTHVVISIGGGKQVLWVNGKKVATEDIPFGGDNRQNGCGNNPIYVYIGGTNVYHGGLIGVVDEVQVWNKTLDETGVADAMMGYKDRTIPNDLYAYWNFEEIVPLNSESENETDKRLSSFPNLGKGGESLKATIIKFEGAGGEDTSGTIAVPVLANNNELGNPAIGGTLDVKTTANWELPGVASSVESDKSVTVKYANSGNYNVNLSLINRWGRDSKTGAVVIIDPTGIENTQEVEALNVYPNPFVDGVNILFAKGGQYSVDICGIDGKAVGMQKLDVAANETVYVAVNGTPGMYIIRVMDGERCVKSIKVCKQ